MSKPLSKPPTGIASHNDNFANGTGAAFMD
jgi:hypothetical protein